MNVGGRMGSRFGVKPAEVCETWGKTISYRDDPGNKDRISGSLLRQGYEGQAVKCIRGSVAVKRVDQVWESAKHHTYALS
jgi:hypothetical protein